MTTWPISRSFPIMTCRLLFPTWRLPTMALAIICRNGSEPFERTLLTVLTACLYHPSLSSLHSLHFPPFSFIYLLPPSFSFIHLSLFAFINLHSPSFIFIHLHSNSFNFIYLHSHSFYVTDFQFISLAQLVTRSGNALGARASGLKLGRENHRFWSEIG